MTVEEYRQRMIQAFHNADCDELIAVCVLPEEFGYLEWLLKNHYKKEPCEDAISRQEVLSYLCAHCPDNAECFDDCDDIKNIKALPSVKPQEPFNIDTYCKEHFVVMVDKYLWEKAEKALEQEPILDKIRAEIKQLPIYGAKFLNGYFTVHVDVDEVLQIIDKYRGEADCHECKAEYECYYCKKYEESEDKE